MIHDCASELQGGVSLMSEDTSLYSNDSFSSAELENYRYVNNIDGTNLLIYFIASLASYIFTL